MEFYSRKIRGRSIRVALQMRERMIMRLFSHAKDLWFYLHVRETINNNYGFVIWYIPLMNVFSVRIGENSGSDSLRSNNLLRFSTISRHSIWTNIFAPNGCTRLFMPVATLSYTSCRFSHCQCTSIWLQNRSQAQRKSLVFRLTPSRYFASRGYRQRPSWRLRRWTSHETCRRPVPSMPEKQTRSILRKF